MDTNHLNPKENTDTFQVLEQIEKTKVSPFFKVKVLNQIREQSTEKEDIRFWMNPRLQYAAFFLLLGFNLTILIYTLNKNAEATIDQLSGIESLIYDYSLDSDNLSLN